MGTRNLTVVNNMKRYLLFMFYTYYPQGGRDDYKGDFDTLDEVKKYIEDFNANQEIIYYYHDILDLESKKWMNLDI